MNFAKITNDYYSKWLDVIPAIMNSNGVIFIESLERDKCQSGYSQTFDVYTYITNKLIIISYTKKTSDKIEKIKHGIHLGMTAEDITNIMETEFNTRVGRQIKFCFDKLPNDIEIKNVIMLCDMDYPKYLEFFKTQYPNATYDGWLEKYFYDTNRSGFAFGIFEKNKLVCATDAPNMPYMKDLVQEVGINTLSKYRGKGYAKSVTLACIRAIIEKNKCPQWSCSYDNIASEKLAYGVGYRKLANILTISLL